MSEEYKDVELHERVAKIEQQVEHIDSIASERLGRWENLNERLDRIEDDLERYRGAVGAVLLVATAVTTFFKLFWADIKRFFT